jgi:hypothetical protein
VTYVAGSEAARGTGLAGFEERKQALMTTMSFGDAARRNLRALVATIDREITELPVAGAGNPATVGLRASWTELVAVLALGPAPETRQCPVCGGTGMRSASRCSQCWAKLEPQDAVASAAPATTPEPPLPTMPTMSTASDEPRSAS